MRVHKDSGNGRMKVEGRADYFGKMAGDPQGTATPEKWLCVKNDLLAGRGRKDKAEPLTVEALCNLFSEGQGADAARRARVRSRCSPLPQPT